MKMIEGGDKPRILGLSIRERAGVGPLTPRYEEPGFDPPAKGERSQGGKTSA
jgi:hypothetical protein